MARAGSIYDVVYDLVCRVPAGRVATYGQIARIAGCSARQVGYAMAALSFDSDVPWQRVINSSGKVSPRGSGDGSMRQRERLELEGIRFSLQGRVDLIEFGWVGPGGAWASADSGSHNHGSRRSSSHR